MQLIIHRGTKEIGGSCVELRSDKSRILIDFGIPLVTNNRESFNSRILTGKSLAELRKLNILPNVGGLYKDKDRKVDAVFDSHSHMDHYGFLKYVHPDIPIYMSEGAKALIEISDIFTPYRIGHIAVRVIKKRKRTKIGNFTVTPYQVDHSAFDAFAYLIEADKKRVFYSGDFRGHGRKSALFKRMLANPPADIDCLIMEGTAIGKARQEYKDEKAVQSRFERILKYAKGATFLFVSSQNIDRLVSAYKACIRTGTIFVIDIYTAYILDKLKKVSKNIPQFNWRSVRVKFLKGQADILARNVSKRLLYRYNKRKIELSEINDKKDKVLMLARDNSIFPILVKKIEDVKDSKIIYSMWEGYLTDKFRQYCSENGIAIEHVHASGHATVRDLKAFAKAIDPKILVPIHTFESSSYPRLFNNVKVLEDREVLVF